MTRRKRRLFTIIIFTTFVTTCYLVGVNLPKKSDRSNPVVRLFRPIDKCPQALPVLVLAHDRPQALEGLLNKLREIRAHDFSSGKINSQACHPVIVSIDSNHDPTVEVAKEMADYLIEARTNWEPAHSVKPHLRGYYYISRHYRLALDAVFALDRKFNEVIILEDDLVLAKDFLDYFRFFRPLPYMDPTVLTVSAWNDNGFTGKVAENAPYLVHRTDFFPGLGWLMTRTLWNELKLKWPSAYWDDWLRADEQRKNRSCIRPELSRVAMSAWGRKGVSNGEFFADHISRVKIHTHRDLNWNQFDANKTLGLLVKDRYDRIFESELRHCKDRGKGVKFNHSILWNTGEKCEVQEYRDQTDLRAKLWENKLMNDVRGGVFRTSYNGVIQTMRNGKRLFLVPHSKKRYF